MEIMKCIICDGKGTAKVPSNKEAFNQAFKKWEQILGGVSWEVREKALEETGYKEIICPDCDGKGYI